MKFLCNGISLSDAINRVSKALPSRTIETQRILECVKAEAADGKLVLTASDGELTISHAIVAEVIEGGSAAVPGKFIVDFSRHLPDVQVECTLSGRSRMRLRYNDSEVYVQCLEPVGFPEIKRMNDPSGVSIMGCELKELISRTVFCVSMDSARPALRGVCFDVEDYTVTAMSLDGFRLMKVMKPLEKKSKGFNAIIPARSLVEIGKLVTDENSPVTLFFEGDFLLVENESTRIFVRLLSGSFINYEQILPKEFFTYIVVNRQMFAGAMERAGVLGKNDSKTITVTLTFRENVMTVKGHSEIGDLTENIPVDMKGRDLTIAFNVRYLIDFLSNVNDEFLKMSFASGISPAIITPAGSDEAKYRYLVVPIRLIAESAAKENKREE